MLKHTRMKETLAKYGLSAEIMWFSFHKTLLILMHSLQSEVEKLHRVLAAAILCCIFGVIAFGFFSYLLITASVRPLAMVVAVLTGVAFFGLAYWVYERLYTTRLNCPNCKKHLPAFDPWMCPLCDNVDDVPAHIKEYEAVNKGKEFFEQPPWELWKRPRAYRFLYKCPTCSEKATTFKCHNCGEVLALTEDPNPKLFAYHPLRLPGGMLEIEEDSKMDESYRVASKNPEVNAILDKLYTRDEIMDVLEKRKEYYDKQIESGRMTSEEAQKFLRQEKMFLHSRMTLG